MGINGRPDNIGRVIRHATVRPDVQSHIPIRRAGSTGRCNTIGYKFFLKRGEAFRDSAGRHVGLVGRRDSAGPYRRHRQGSTPIQSRYGACKSQALNEKTSGPSMDGLRTCCRTDIRGKAKRPADLQQAGRRAGLGQARSPVQSRPGLSGQRRTTTTKSFGDQPQFKRDSHCSGTVPRTAQARPRSSNVPCCAPSGSRRFTCSRRAIRWSAASRAT